MPLDHSKELEGDVMRNTLLAGEGGGKGREASQKTHKYVRTYLRVHPTHYGSRPDFNLLSSLGFPGSPSSRRLRI
eukprot:scaffold20732_cov108-Skeletonema_menzelii.AAC.1